MFSFRLTIVLILIGVNMPMYAMFNKPNSDTSVDLVKQAFAHATLSEKCMQRIMQPLNQSIMSEKIGRLMQSETEVIEEALNAFENPSQWYQEMGKKAQSDVGVKPEKQAPIVKMTTKVDSLRLGMANPNYIAFDEDVLNQVPMGVRRHVIYHEAVHKLHNDYETESILDFLPNMMLPIAFGIQVTTKKPFIAIGASLAYMVALHNLKGSYPFFCERRADRMGAYATKCHVCVTDTARYQETKNNANVDKGYLSSFEFHRIAQDLAQKNLVCEEHGKSERDENMQK